jgi:A/G-specific adenine glycosylase
VSADAASERPAGFAEAVIAWQRQHGRNGLPWQHTRDPYRVWLSEIMLQQTQVATVLGYYQRFLDRFADVEVLAAASQDDVLALWSGLGYYSRARNLHRCAQAVVEQHGGRFPASSAELANLPGIGRSTACAIAAFCFGERVAILDGNVKRVLARLLAFDGDLAVAASERRLWAEATVLVPTRNIDVYTQGIMDLGATVCVRRMPLCQNCPARAMCAAAKEGTQLAFPVKTRRLARRRQGCVWLCIEHGGKIRLTRRPDSGIWAGLWSLPELASTDALAALTAEWPGEGEWGETIRHVLTHRDLELQPMRWRLPETTAAHEWLEALSSKGETARWFTVDEALAAGIPAPLRRWLIGGSVGTADSLTD